MLTKNLCYFSFKKNGFYYDEELNTIEVHVVSLISFISSIMFTAGTGALKKKPSHP